MTGSTEADTTIAPAQCASSTWAGHVRHRRLHVAGNTVVRLMCFHLLHFRCLDRLAFSIPRSTVATTLACPACQKLVMPNAEYHSPVTEALRDVLANCRWADMAISPVPSMRQVSNPDFTTPEAQGTGRRRPPSPFATYSPADRSLQVFRDGRPDDIPISPWFKKISGEKLDLHGSEGRARSRSGLGIGLVGLAHRRRVLPRRMGTRRFLCFMLVLVMVMYLLIGTFTKAPTMEFEHVQTSQLGRQDWTNSEGV